MNPVLWLHHARPRSSWYTLDADERRRLTEDWRRTDDASLSAGAEHLGTFRVRGQSDWSTVSVWRFADVDAAMRHWEARVEAGYASWFAFSNELGADADGGRVEKAS